MICYKGKAFCASTNCQNECGRKLTSEMEEEARKFNLFISYACFCDIPKPSEIDEIKENRIPDSRKKLASENHIGDVLKKVLNNYAMPIKNPDDK